MYVEEDIVRLKAEFPNIFEPTRQGRCYPMSVELELGTRPHQAHSCTIKFQLYQAGCKR